MSNTQVGNVYAQIIGDVIDSSRVDFEEGGVDENVLEALKRGWEQKLSQLGVATFPWDPKLEAPPIVNNNVNPPTVPSNGANAHYSLSGPLPNQMPPQQMPQAQQINNNSDARIKTEPGLEPSLGGMNQPGYQPSVQNVNGPQRAAERASASLMHSYGARAAASISTIQSNAHPQGQNPGQPTAQQLQAFQMHQQQQQQQQQQHMAQRQQQLQQQQQQQQQVASGIQQPKMSQEQYKQAMAMQARQQLQKQNGVDGAQTDGAGDEYDGPAAVVKRVTPNGEEELGRVEIDGLIRDKIAAMGQAMEGGGLMLPLHQATDSKKRQRKVVKTTSGLPQNDGVGSDDGDDNKDNVKDEELDEDAINSDLDDPDDGLDDEEDDEDGMGHIMLCMYDKVQRVKNKWKCVMKDGVLTINSKEYVFHKAQGEYEW